MLLSNKTSELFDASKQGVMDSLSNYNYTEQPYNYARKYIQRFVIMYQQEFNGIKLLFYNDCMGQCQQQLYSDNYGQKTKLKGYKCLC